MHTRQFAIACLFCAAAAACGGDGGGTEPPPDGVASVAVTAPTAQAVPQEEVQLVVRVLDIRGVELTDRPIAWESSSDAVATVSTSGLVTAVAPGSVTITATCEGKSGSAQLTVREGARIGPDGGTVSSLDGGVTLEVPSGALASPVTIVVSRKDEFAFDPSVVGVGYAFTPNTVVFGTAATLTLRYPGAEGPSGVPESELRVHRLETSGLRSQESQIDAAADVATAAVTRLGTYAVARPPAETPCAAPEYRQFDFWVGRWNVTPAAAPPGAPPVPRDITLEPGGCAVFENFANGTGRSINVFNPTDGMWHQTFVSATGSRLVITGGLQGSAMVLSRPFPDAPPGSFDRWTWTQLSGGRVRQLQEISRDGGETVETGFDGTYVPR
jgi:hypothetical protein